MLNEFVQHYACGDSNISTLHFRIPLEGTSNYPKKYYTPVCNEVIYDSYFQILPACTIDKGYWPKQRVVYTKPKECTNTFIFKEQVQKTNSNLNFKLETFSSNIELMDHILDNMHFENNPNVLFTQDFISETIILRYVLKHNSQPNVELHICSLKLKDIFFNYGKLRAKDVNMNQLEKLWKEITPLDMNYLLPTNSPVMQKLICDDSSMLNCLPKEVYKFGRGDSFSKEPIVMEDDNFNNDLIKTFKYALHYTLD